MGDWHCTRLKICHIDEMPRRSWLTTQKRERNSMHAWWSRINTTSSATKSKTHWSANSHICTTCATMFHRLLLNYLLTSFIWNSKCSESKLFFFAFSIYNPDCLQFICFLDFSSSSVYLVLFFVNFLLVSCFMSKLTTRQFSSTVKIFSSYCNKSSRKHYYIRQQVYSACFAADCTQCIEMVKTPRSWGSVLFGTVLPHVRIQVGS